MSTPSPTSSPTTGESDRLSRREFLRRSTFLGLAGASAGMLLAACGNSEGNGDSASSGENASTGETSGGAASGQADRTVTLHPEGNQMRYRETEFTVAPGETIELVFDNTATSPSMQHNVVILDTPPEDEFFQKVGEGGMEAGSRNDYVPDMEIVRAHTAIAKPGETVSTTFTAPEETGDYGYVCTYPGHWATMRGTMHVEEGAGA